MVKGIGKGGKGSREQVILRGKWGRRHYLQKHLCAWQECEDLCSLSSKLMLVRNAGYRNQTNPLSTEKIAAELFWSVFFEVNAHDLNPDSEGDVFSLHSVRTSPVRKETCAERV